MRPLTTRKIFFACLTLALAFSVSWVAFQMPSTASAKARKQNETTRKIEDARAALERAISRRDTNPTPQTQTKAGKAHKAFQDAVSTRINEILKSLKQLESKIEKPKSEGTTDSEAFLQASAKAFERSGVKDEYLALQEELAGLYDSLGGYSRSIAEFQTQGINGNGVPVGPGCPPAAITNTLGGTSPNFPSTTGQIADRLIQNGAQATCAAPKTCPGTTDAGARTFDQYQFTNTGCATACVTVTLTIGAGACGSTLLPVAYQTSFNPAN